MIHRTANLRLAFFFSLLLSFLLSMPGSAFAQGGPPYYTNDPGTPGDFNWEINIGYMPFDYSGQSVAHTPDLDINFGIGDRIQLTYESAWLRVRLPNSPEAKFGMNQSNPGVKWRFLDHGEGSLQISIFPQFFLDNPNDAVRRGITPSASSFLMPIEFTKKVGPLDVNWEVGYQWFNRGPNGWISGLVVGKDITKKLELDAEFYATGYPGYAQPTLDFGARYKLHKPIILLLMAGRGLQPASANQPYFIGYFGVQLLLPSKSYPSD
ncbi:MAG: hypothetical protein WBG02_06615 [Candidatus Acidiferrum sp.]